MTDEEMIALAALHGCAFYKYDHAGRIIWYARTVSGEVHPVEHHQARITNGHRRFFYTREELARAYCEFYGLLSEATHGA